MKVMVTGGAGCIGLATCRELVERGHDVYLFDLPEQITRVEEAISDDVKACYGSILDRSSIRQVVKGCDAIVHLAAYLGVARTEANRLRTLEINIEGTKNLLDLGAQHDVTRFLFASSSEVYGEPHQNPVTEETSLNGETVYAVSKMAGEELCRAYAQEHDDFEHVILRFFNTYGLHQVAQFVIPRFIWRVLHDEPPLVHGDGSQVRSYCYADDTARAVGTALEAEVATGEAFNIGNGNETVTLLELAERVIRIAGKENELKPEVLDSFRGSDRDEDREIQHRICDSSKAEELLNWRSEVSLDEGLGRLIATEAVFPQWETPVPDDFH